MGQPCQGMYSSIMDARLWMPRRGASGLEAAGSGGAGTSGLEVARSLAYLVSISSCFSPSLTVDEAEPKRLSEGELDVDPEPEVGAEVPDCPSICTNSMPVSGWDSLAALTGAGGATTGDTGRTGGVATLAEVPGSCLGSTGTAAGAEAVAVSGFSFLSLGLRRGTFFATDAIEASLDVDDDDDAEYFRLVSAKAVVSWAGPFLVFDKAGPPRTAMPTCCSVVWYIPAPSGPGGGFPRWASLPRSRRRLFSADLFASNSSMTSAMLRHCSLFVRRQSRRTPHRA